jgi:hypothetical protein
MAALEERMRLTPQARVLERQALVLAAAAAGLALTTLITLEETLA